MWERVWERVFGCELEDYLGQLVDFKQNDKKGRGRKGGPHRFEQMTFLGGYITYMVLVQHPGEKII